MPSFIQHEDTFSSALTNLSGASIAAGSETKAANALSNDQQYATILGVTVDYGTTAAESVEVRIYPETDDGVYANSPKITFPLPTTASSTEDQQFEVPATISAFEVGVFNPSANDGISNVTVKEKQSTIDSN